jgi:hypothetical protein
VPWTAIYAADVLRKIRANNKATRSVIIFKLHPRDYNMIVKALAKEDFKNIQLAYVVRVDANVKGTKKFTQSVEMLVVAFTPNADAFDWQLSSNPVERIHLLFVNKVTTFFKAAGAKEQLNPAQSSLGICAALGQAWNISPRAHILNGCSGSGSDAIAFAGLGFQVTAVEASKAQAKGMKQRFEQLIVTLEDKNPDGTLVYRNLLEYIEKTDGIGTFSPQLWRSVMQEKEQEKKQMLDQAEQDEHDQTHCPVCEESTAPGSTKLQSKTCEDCKRSVHENCMTVSIEDDISTWRCVRDNDRCKLFVAQAASEEKSS